MISVSLSKENYDLIKSLVVTRIKESEATLGKGILDDDSSVIGEATARIRVWEGVLKELKRSIEQS